MREERGNEMRQMKGKISKFETRRIPKTSISPDILPSSAQTMSFGQGPRRAWRTQPLTERSRMTSGA